MQNLPQPCANTWDKTRATTHEEIIPVYIDLRRVGWIGVDGQRRQ
ncbi:MAG: hypothetical protein AB1813_21805 [Verrucomicrobiota bacterium]